MDNKLFNRKWRSDTAKSLFREGREPSAEERVYEQVGDGYKLTVRGTFEGKEYEWGYTAAKDGEPFPVYGREDVDTIIAHKVTDEITIGDFFKNGKIVAFYKRGVKDSGSLTVVVGGIENNRPYFEVIEYTD